MPCHDLHVGGVRDDLERLEGDGLGVQILTGRFAACPVLFSRPDNNWESVIPRPSATLTKLEKLRLDSPLSIVPINVL